MATIYVYNETCLHWNLLQDQHFSLVYAGQINRFLILGLYLKFGMYRIAAIKFYVSSLIAIWIKQSVTDQGCCTVKASVSCYNVVVVFSRNLPDIPRKDSKL